MTYAETKGEKPLDWNEWLDKAIKSPEAYPDDHDEKVGMAYSWVTCACGNMCSVIPRFTREDEENEIGTEHGPKDQDLAELGIYFAWDVESGDFEEAKDTLKKIEQRSAFLIANLHLNPSAS